MKALWYSCSWIVLNECHLMYTQTAARNFEIEINKCAACCLFSFYQFVLNAELLCECVSYAYTTKRMLYRLNNIYLLMFTALNGKREKNLMSIPYDGNYLRVNFQFSKWTFNDANERWKLKFNWSVWWF
jgi:hypothetical protein